MPVMDAVAPARTRPLTDRMFEYDEKPVVSGSSSRLQLRGFEAGLGEDGVA
jgi:hypothetical protein